MALVHVDAGFEIEYGVRAKGMHPLDEWVLKGLTIRELAKARRIVGGETVAVRGLILGRYKGLNGRFRNASSNEL